MSSCSAAGQKNCEHTTPHLIRNSLLTALLQSGHKPEVQMPDEGDRSRIHNLPKTTDEYAKLEES